MLGISLVDKFIEPKDRVMVTKMGNIIELQYMEKYNRTAKIRKIDKNSYEVLATGEIKQFELSETRKDNINSLRQTFKKLSYLINNNFSGRKNELWITLTYSEKEYDPKKVAKDYELFLKRLKYQTKELGELGAICVKEPHADGSWHMHVLLKYVNRKKAYIANERLRDIWGHGFVKINRIKQTDNLGAYLTAYLTDVSLDELDVVYDTDSRDEVFVSDDELSQLNVSEAMLQNGSERICVTKTDKSKAVVKGGRLDYYPVDMKIYTHTQNMNRPERVEMDYDYARELYELKDENLTIRRSVKIEDEENDFENTIVIEQYNKRVTNYGSFLSMVRKYRESMVKYETGKLAKDFFYKEIRKSLYELENRCALAKMTKDYILN